MSAMLADHVQAYIDEHVLLPPGAGVVVGVSGGADSVVLLHVLRALGYAARAAHVNYGLRGAASDADEAHVRRLCAAWHVPLRVRRVDAKAEAGRRGTSVQAAARALRYDFFGEVAAREGIRHVAVGHHRDDQAETLLLNLFRGSGVEGLAGMAPARALAPDGHVRLVRPLLHVRRTAVERYAQQHDLPWRTDATNADPKYRRGALRAEVIPLLEEKINASVVDAVARAADLVRAYVAEAVRPELAARFAGAARAEEEGGVLRLEALRSAPGVWRHRLILEALRRWLPEAPQSAALAREVGRLVEAQVGRRVEVAGGAVWRERGALRFISVEEAEGVERGHVPPRLDLGGRVRVAGGWIEAEALAACPETLERGAPHVDDPHVAVMDCDRLRFPLAVRPWRAGDRLQPLGMTGHKKVSDLLTDAHVPPHVRRRILVVCSEDAAGEDVVAWVVGVRLAAPVRVRPGTARCVRLTFERDDRRPG